MLLVESLVLQFDEFVLSLQGFSKKFKRMAADGSHLYLKIHDSHHANMLICWMFPTVITKDSISIPAGVDRDGAIL